MARVTITDLQKRKRTHLPLVVITAYDYLSARLVEQAQVDVILVGDSLGMVVLGYDSTLPVTLDEMIHHSKAVMRGTERALVVVDLPFLTYQVNPEDALRNAGRVLKETGAAAVKLEGGAPMVETVRRLVTAGIPVMGHLGLTPQSVNQLGGYHVQGKTPAAAAQLLQDALALEQAGIFSLVLETVPADLARTVSQRLRVPTIGIGAGPWCDGQVQVFHDLLGIEDRFRPHHAKRYAELADAIRQAVATYVEEVKTGVFPTALESFGMEAMPSKQSGAAAGPASEESR